jgi:hypothetical protein
MHTLHLEVQSRIVGTPTNVSPLDPILIELLEQRITVAELIRRVVEEQIRHLIIKRSLNSEDVQYALARQYLSASEVQTQAEQGRIRLSARPPKKATKVNLEDETDSYNGINSESEIQKALDAFQTNQYYVLINGEPAKQLDEMLTFDVDTKISFVRITPLVGG